ncbi:MAG: TolC family protein [Lewinellaceae bacterium]|nr:TolC family protein [Lewinella sp.]MCB9280899.1 TolC family protein [Lewinellaceae bacterium]
MRLILALLFVCSLVSLSAQQAASDTLFLSLEQTIALAHKDAPDVQIAKTAFVGSYWRFRSFQADYKPIIQLEGDFPNINRSIQSIILPDGQEKFIPRSLMNNSLGVSVQQGIGLTGGRIFARTQLQRLDIFSSGTAGGQVSYLVNPISFGFIQPIFGFNSLKWNKRIEPLRYEESQKGYSEDMEEVSYQTANLFFDVLIAQLNLEAARRDKANADTLYAISKGRFEVGRIAETELLQIELRVMSADADLSSNMLALQTSTERLRDFLGIREAVYFKLDPPAEIPTFQIDAEEALTSGRANRSQTINFQRQLEEAERNVAQARANRGFNMDFYLSFGLSQTAPTFNEALRNPLDQELVTLGMNVPIVDWGKSKATVETAVANANLTRLQVDQQRVNFEREILVKVQQFDLVRSQVRIAERSHEIALKRLDMTRKRYLIGNILITDLNLAILEEASARQGYTAALRNFWLAYYDLRRLTLYDFENDRSLIQTPSVNN